ncbi:MAG: hypothetical protein NTU44_01790 [Bacteroidetes bacterium]|nr:hypothetical protein [Bacteroidota bacterium]
MKAFTIKELKEELTNCSSAELLELCLRLSKFKKENKELLTYLLFESSDEGAYIESVKREMDGQFEQINTTTYYFIKKSVRKILLNLKKCIRFSNRKETEIELLMYFCAKLKAFTPSIQHNNRLRNIYNGQIELIKKKLTAMHEDLQHDYLMELEAIDK